MILMMECRRNGERLRKKIDVDMEEFPVIIQSINVFLSEPYTAVINGTIFEKQWNAKEGSWE